MKSTRRKKSASASLLLSVSLSGAVALAPLPARAQSLAELRAAHKAAYDPRVPLLLKRMADAYAALTELDQKTEFFVLQTPMIQGTGNREQGTGNREQGTEEEKRRRGEEETGNVDTNHEPRTTNHEPPAANHEEGALSHGPTEKAMGRTVRLLLAAPNLLRMDTVENASETEAAKHAVTVCDGKLLWTYNPEKNWYTQAKAPRRVHDFQKVSLPNTTLELMMLVGMNPFGDIENQFDGAKYEGVQNVGGVPVEVVLLRAASEQQTQELRFYIGKNDLLLHRLVIESTPTVRALAPPKHDPLDDLAARPSRPVPTPTPDVPGVTSPQVAPGFEDPHPLAPPGTPMKTRITCDNTLTVTPRFDDRDFEFTPPTGASLYQSINGDNELSKLSNKVTMADLLKQANSGKKAKKSRPVRVTP